MISLEDIAIQVADRQEQPVTAPVTANVMALLHEITTLLRALLDTGAVDSIDLRSLPLLPGEYEALKLILGEGEVSVSINTLGGSQIYETRIAGVWWVSHDDESGERLAEFIEVTRMPEIMKSDRLDIEDACAALQQQLGEWREQDLVTRS